MAIYLKITNPTEVVKKKTSKWLTDITLKELIENWSRMK